MHPDYSPSADWGFLHMSLERFETCYDIFDLGNPFPMQDVGNIPFPKEYAHPHANLYIGEDPITGYPVLFGEGVVIACLLEDKPDEDDIPD